MALWMWLSTSFLFLLMAFSAGSTHRSPLMMPQLRWIFSHPNSAGTSGISCSRKWEQKGQGYSHKKKVWKKCAAKHIGAQREGLCVMRSKNARRAQMILFSLQEIFAKPN